MFAGKVDASTSMLGVPVKNVARVDGQRCADSSVGVDEIEAKHSIGTHAEIVGPPICRAAREDKGTGASNVQLADSASIIEVAAVVEHTAVDEDCG